MKITILVLVSILWLITASLSSCTSDENQTVYDFNQIKHYQWRFVAFDSSGTTMSLDPADTVVLSFQESRLIQGKSSGLCRNDYYGVYFLGDSNIIRFDSLFSSKALCPNSKYWYYYDKLRNVNSIQLDVSRLYLYYDGTKQKLVYEKIQ